MLDRKAAEENYIHAEKSVQKNNKALSAKKKKKADKALNPENGLMSWSVYENGLPAKEILCKKYYFKMITK